MAALPFILTAMFLLVAYWQRKAERETKVTERDITETIYD